LSFFPTPTVCSTHCFAGLLHPAADHGVRTVLSLSATSIARCRACQTLFRTYTLRSIFPPLLAETRHPDITAWFTESRAPLVVSSQQDKSADKSEDPSRCCCDPRGLTIAESVASHRCCHQCSTRYSHGLLRLRALTLAPRFPLCVHLTEVKCARSASTASGATAFPTHRLRNESVTAGTSASFRTAVPPKSKLSNDPSLCKQKARRAETHPPFGRSSPKPCCLLGRTSMFPQTFTSTAACLVAGTKPEPSHPNVATQMPDRSQSATEADLMTRRGEVEVVWYCQRPT